MIKKVLFAIAGVVMASVSSAQTSIWNDPNIKIPASSVPHVGHKNTNYVIYKGPRLRGNKILAGAPSADTPGQDHTPDGYWPSDIHTAYQITNNLGTGAIAVVIWYDNPNALTDFNTFSTQFGLPTESSTNATSNSNKNFQVVYAQGTQPQANTDTAGESSLDIEWTHAMAPKAKIYLVEATDSSDANLFGAVAVAKNLPGVKEVTQSWGVPGESSNAAALDQQYYNNNGVVYFASAGDIGGVQSYPATSAYVVAVGGTSLDLDSNDNITSETAWSDSGGGPSVYITRPSYQDSISTIVGGARGTPDISAVADPNSGVAVYSSYGFGGWGVVGGTSVSSPMSAGIANARAQWSTGPLPELNRIYKTIYASATLWKSLYHDVVSGSAGSFTAKVGWDFITGIGAPHNMFAVQSNLNYSASNVQLIAGTEIKGSLFNLSTINQLPYGETAAISEDFVIGHPASAFGALSLNGTLTAPLRATEQVFLWNAATQKFDSLVSYPGNGAANSVTQDLTSLLSTYVFQNSSGQYVIRIALRAVTPLRVSSSPFEFSIGTFTLSGYLSS